MKSLACPPLAIRPIHRPGTSGTGFRVLVGGGRARSPDDEHLTKILLTLLVLALMIFTASLS